MTVVNQTRSPAERARLTRRRATGYLAAALGGASLAACTVGGTQTGETELAKQPPRSVPLILWARGKSDKDVFDAITPVVEARYPHLAIGVEAVSQIYDKLIVAVAGGDAPDLTVINMPSGVPLIGRGMFLSLQKYLARDRDTNAELKNSAAPALQAYRHKNEPYAIPITNEAIVFWYNEDALRQANLTPPHEIENDPQKWNWETALDYARTLNRGRGQDRERFGLWIGSGIQGSWGNLVYSNGGRILNDDASQMVLSQPPAVEAVQWAVDTIWRHDVGPQLATLKETAMRTLFTTGRLAMTMDGEYFRRYLFGPQTPQGVPFRFNLAQIPFAPRTRKRANVFHTLGLPILREAKQPDAAWQYARVFATKEAQQFVTDRWGSRGGHEKTYEPWLKSNAGGGPPANYAAITKSDAHGLAYPATPYLASNELLEHLNRLMPQMFDNKLTVRAGLQQVDQETNARLQPVARDARG